MFREEFLQEVKEARMEARMGKLIDWKELQKSWKKSHEKIWAFIYFQIWETYSKLTKPLKERIDKAIEKICENPYFGKPLKYELKGTRRIHIGPFVLIYSIKEKKRQVIFLKFAHHDEAYKL